MSLSGFDPKIHHRQSIRLQGFDYSRAGAYFVTIVTHGRDCLFGEIVDGELKLNRFVEIVKWEWLELPKRLHYIEFGAFMVMPNHFHGILIIRDTVGATRPGLTVTRAGNAPSSTMPPDGIDGSPLPDKSSQPHGPQPASLGAVIAKFKSRVTKRLWKIPSMHGKPIWQRNYFEHIIRNDREMERIRHYIETNPSAWMEDDENPLKHLSGRPGE